MLFFINKGEQAAKLTNAHLIQTGILPTINRTDVVMDNLTPLKRYFCT